METQPDSDLKAMSAQPPAFRQFEAFPTVNLAALRATCGDLVTALASGAKRVALVGPAGSGKTYALDVFSRAASNRAQVRTARQARRADTLLDLVDGADEAGLGAVAAEPAWDGKQIIAVRPDALPVLRSLVPGIEAVAMRPIAVRDVRTMMEARRKHLQLPIGVFTLKALASLERLCDGNPGKLDLLAGRALRVARAANAGRITASHVELAMAELAAEAHGTASVQDAHPAPSMRRPHPAPHDESAPLEAGNAGSEQASVDADFADSAEERDFRPSDHPGRLPSVPSPPAVQPDTQPILAASAASAWDRLRQPLPPGEAAAAKQFDSHATRRTTALACVPIVATLAVCATYAVRWNGGGIGQTGISAQQVAQADTVPAEVKADGKPGEIAVQFKEANPAADSARPLTEHVAAPEAKPEGVPDQPPSRTAMAAMPLPPVTPDQQPAPDAPSPKPPTTRGQSASASSNEPVPEMMEPTPAPEAGQDAVAEQLPQGDHAKAVRLLELGKAMLAIGQVDDARVMLAASAQLGNSDAVGLIASSRDGRKADQRP